MISGMDWNVLKTRSRQENIVAAELAKRGVEAFLPKVGEVKRWSDRRKLVSMPLFPGYVFVKPSAEQIHTLGFVPGGCGLLMNRNTPGAIREKEIDAIRVLLGSKAPIDLHKTLLPGTRVRVLIGPLAGVEGELIQFRNNHRLVINAYLIGQAVSVEVNANEVGKV